MGKLQAQITLFDPGELESIHCATLEVLATVGCRLPHRRVLDRLAAAGAKVDYGTATARLPEDLVEKALAALGGEGAVRRGAVKPILRAGPIRIGTGCQANIIDYGSDRRRQGTTEDVLKGIALCNALPHVKWAMPLVIPADVPAHLADLHCYHLGALYSRKAFGVYIMSAASARGIIRLAEIKSGGARPEVGYLLEPNGALSYDDFSLEMAVTFADAGYPFYLGPMAMAGLDAPATIAGTLVMQNAYNLIGILLAYLWGVPGSWSGTAHTMDLRSCLCSFGSPNQILIGLAAIQLGNWYGFEVGVNSGLTDACLPDFQAGFEKGASAVAALLAGAAGLGAQGIVGADQGISFEQLVIDDEWAGAIDHIFSHGVEVNEETLGVAAIKRVGILGNFLTDEHTVAHMRETYWRSRIFNHESWDSWRAKGGKDVYARAHEEVERILAEHYPPPLLVEPPVKEAMDGVIEEARRHPEWFRAERYRYVP